MSAKAKAEIHALLCPNGATKELAQLVETFYAREEALKRRLRDDFARSALPSLIEQFPPKDYPCHTSAEYAYACADAMLEARK